MKLWKAVVILALVTTFGGAAANAQTAQSGVTKFSPPLADINQSKAPEPPLSSLMADVHGTVSASRVSLHGLAGIVLTVQNGTARPIVVDTEHAVAAANGIDIKAALPALIDRAACPREVPPLKYEDTAERIVAATVTLGAAQAVRDIVNQHGPVLKRYGCDETRREDELNWFGRRVVWPGQSMEGIVYFVFPVPQAKTVLRIPVSTIYDDTDCATLLVQ